MRTVAIRSIPLLLIVLAAYSGCTSTRASGKTGGVTAGDPGAAGATRHFSISGDDLVLGDLIGEVRVEPADGATYEIDVTVRGHDAAPDRIKFDEKSGGDAHLYVQFPVKDADHFIYPPMGSSSTRISPKQVESGGGDSWDLLDWVLPGHHHTVRISGKGSGLELWADVVVKVPREKSIKVRQGVGAIEAEGTTGAMDLDMSSGSVTARRITGNLKIDTGSGDVRTAETSGDLNIDTGSGSVDTGKCKGASVRIDTGSGSVRVADLDCKDLRIDTGSGSVEAAKIGADAARIDTGSGHVAVGFARLGAGDFRIDTGSGRVDVRVPSDASAKIHAETGSGGVEVDIANAKVKHKSDDEITIVLGDGAAKMRIETGSGGVRIGQD